MIKYIISIITAIILLIVTCCYSIFGYNYDGGNYVGGNSKYIGNNDKPLLYKKIQDKVYSDYKWLISNKKVSFNEFCYPKKYKIQPQQIFGGEFMKPDKTVKELLVYHLIGSGKSCLSIQIGEKWKSIGKPLFIMPSSLIPGFRNELRTQCAKDAYLNSIDCKKLKNLDPTDFEYKEIIEKSNKKIDKSYTIMSYNKFLTDGKYINSPIIIIDEVQNINNINGKYFNSILTWITKHPSSSVVIMSGTPLFDSSRELYGLAKLLRIPIEDNKIIEVADIKHLFAGKITYFQGAPAFTYPHKTLKIVHCQMSSFQSKWYKSEVEAELKKNNDGIKLTPISNDFYIKSRQRSNVVYKNGMIGSQGIKIMKHKDLTTNLQTYSTKMYEIMKKLRKNQLSFIYSSFTEWGGILFLTYVLDAHGYKNYSTHGPGFKRYVLWTGKENNTQKDKIRSVFNNSKNDDASQIQIVIGSPSIKEGVTLLRVRQEHLLEPYWNWSRVYQIEGRGIRYCSHKTLPRDEREITVYIYIGTTTKITNKMLKDIISPNISVDMLIIQIANKKREECSEYLDAMIDCAVDKYLYS